MTALIEAASALVADARRKAEALPILRQALAILVEERPQDQARAGRIRGLIASIEEAVGAAPGASGGAVPRARPADTSAAAAALLSRGAGWGPDAWLQAAVALFGARRWALADLAYGRVLESAPGHLGGLCGRGITNVQWAQSLKDDGDTAASRRLFGVAAGLLREAIRLQPDNQDLLTVLGICEQELAAPGP